MANAHRKHLWRALFVVLAASFIAGYVWVVQLSERVRELEFEVVKQQVLRYTERLMIDGHLDSESIVFVRHHLEKDFAIAALAATVLTNAVRYDSANLPKAMEAITPLLSTGDEYWETMPAHWEREAGSWSDRLEMYRLRRREGSDAS